MPLEWKDRGDDLFEARAGCLFLWTINWSGSRVVEDITYYVMTDNEDKCHERCLVEGRALGMDVAKRECEEAVKRVANAILRACT